MNRFSDAAGKIFLICISMLLCGYAGFRNLLWLVISILVNYAFVLALMNSKSCRRLILWLGILFNVGLLFYFKYFNFALSVAGDFLHKEFSPRSILLPLGISFFTFQQIAYIVDSYRGKTNGNSFMDYVLYVVYFPKLVMGPIVKQEVLIPQFNDQQRKQLNPDRMIKGIWMFNFGLFKKVLLADTFAKAVSWGVSNVNSATSMDLILVMFAYTFQIYFDFSGYSDMAIGVSNMLNIELPMNFNSPYKAYSIRDFWKRWHMSLTGFLTEYIYFPLGGSKKGKIRTYLNTLIVFLISGIWHGANWTFILWGVLHGALSIFDRLTEKYRKNIHPAMQWMATMFAVSVLWLLFRADSISEWIMMLKQIVMMQNTSISEGLINAFGLPELNFLLGATNLWYLHAVIRGLAMSIFFFSATTICLCTENAYVRKNRNTVVTAILAALLLVFCLPSLSSESVFVYLNF